MTPAWILDILAAVLLVIAGVSAVQFAASLLRRHGSAVAETAVVHLLMAIAMAGMLASGLTALPDTAWEATFGLLTAWFGYRAAQDASVNLRRLPGGRSALHLAHCAAMLYMLLALAAPPAGANPGMGGMERLGGATMMPRHPTLAVVFALVLVGYSIRDLDQLSSGHYSLTGARVSLASGTVYVRVTFGCRIAIGITMALMLVLMILRWSVLDFALARAATWSTG